MKVRDRVMRIRDNLIGTVVAIEHHYEKVLQHERGLTYRSKERRIHPVRVAWDDHNGMENWQRREWLRVISPLMELAMQAPEEEDAA